MDYRNININAYKQVENAQNYKTTKELEEYRSKRINDVLPATEFIEKSICKGAPLRVLEYCSGSSCLLYSLEKRGLLEKGFGVEISENRFGFAERWKNDHGFVKVNNLNLNVEDLDFPEDSFDLIILVDSAFCYFFPENFDLPEKVVSQISKWLVKGGKCIFDMMTRVKDREMCNKHGSHSYWLEFEAENPFRFGLYKQEIVDSDNSIMFTQNTYIRRDGFIDDSKKEFTRFYTLHEISKMLDRYEMNTVDCFSDFDGNTYEEGASERLVCIGERK
ncbi:class I SAM-dependent methyltransferase [Verrucomicrobia bacterium]|nr:class I SAM-dependent methyltransferase [Verrucomicrobiota bacterium]